MVKTRDVGNFLLDVSDDKKFWCVDGSVFSSLEELGVALGSMEDAIFDYHVCVGKNDFCNWIYDVIGDTSLAKNLRTAKDKKAASRKIKTRITYIKKALKSSEV